VGLSFSATAQIQVISAGGYSVPETISLAPSGFGLFGGSYFIPDAGTSNIWVLPATGGTATPFLAFPLPPVGGNILGGTFLPSGWGALSGTFLVCSETDDGQPPLLFFDGSGSQVTVTFPPSQTGWYTTPMIAPANFGSYGGHLFVTEQTVWENKNNVWRTAPGAGPFTLSLFKSFQGDGQFSEISPFGIEFTPPDWGATFGDRMLVSDAVASINNGPGTRASYIVAVSAGGASSLFATVPLRDGYKDAGGQDVPGQDGLRQMLMAPDNYFLGSLGIPGELLLVSVTGSRNGKGILGELLALDSTGTIVGHLQAGSVLAKFDPRGMLITDDGHLLVVDTSDPILQASASDFNLGRGEDLPPLAVKQDVLNQLTALRSTITDKQDGKKLDEAIDDLTKSTNSALWIDPAHPQPKSGASVFNQEKDTVTKLTSLAGDKHSKVPAATLQGFVGRLVQADAVLALVAINEAFAAKVDPKRIAQANQELATGNRLAVKGKPESAIEQYRNAWSHALKG
jgi:hypothetical protein